MNPPAPEEFTSSHIVALKSENFKRLRAVTIRPDGNVVKIFGKNKAGKSSVLDSIASALGGSDSTPAEPIRRGAKKARIILELEDLTVTRTFTKSGTTLVVEGKDGQPKRSPQELLNRLTGKVTFDPLEFLSLKPPQKRDALRTLVGLDTSKLDADAKKAYDDRTLVNRELAQQKAVLANLPFHKDAPAAEESSGAVLKEIEDANLNNSNFQDAQRLIVDADEEVSTAQDNQTSAEQEVYRLKQALSNAEVAVKTAQAGVTTAKETAVKARTAAATFKEIDVTPLKTKLAGLENTNAKVRANDQRKLTAALVDTKQAESDRLSRRIADCEEKKQTMLDATKFPVEGLSISDDGVLFNDLPIEQASDAEKLSVSVAIAAAMNPKLKIMLARNASLLDEDSLKLLADLAEKHGLQVWMEIVGTDKTGIVIEDGHVAGQEEEEPPPDESTAAPEEQSTLEIPPSR